jgi:hypothetical protein
VGHPVWSFVSSSSGLDRMRHVAMTSLSVRALVPDILFELYCHDVTVQMW